MRKVKKLVSFALCFVVILAMSVTVFADGLSTASTQSSGEYPYGLYNGKVVTLQNHTDIVVRKTAGGDKWPTSNTLYVGYVLTVDSANCNYVNGLWWSQITPDNNANPTYVNSGYSASYLLN